MSELVRPSRHAMAAGVLAAVFVGVAFLARPVPDAVVTWLGGPDGGVDRVGGVRVRYRPAPGTPETELARSARSAAIRRDGDVLVIDFPGVERAMVDDIQEVIVAGGVSLRLARETDFAERVGAGRDVEVVNDEWRGEEDGALRRVPYLRSPSREAITSALRDARARGIVPRDGGEILLEYVSVPRRGMPAPYWRSYELAPEVVLDGSMIEGATAGRDPNTNLPIVLLDFTADGAARFCDFTRDVVGKKVATVLGDRVRSAPIINSRICGGRTSIAMGGDDPGRMQREASALVAVLSPGVFPLGGVIEDARWQPPADVARQEWIGRVLLGLVGGIAVALVVFAAIRTAKPRQRTELVATGGPFPWRRLIVTLLAPAVLLAGAELTLPDVNDVEWEWVVRRAGGGSRHEYVSVIALGILPLLTSFGLVEVIALAVPRLRWRRHDPAGRRALGTAVAIVAIATALVQGYFAARYLEGLSFTGAEVVATHGRRFELLTMLSMATGTMALAVIAGVIREHGLGNGYGALLVSAAAIAFVRPLVTDAPEWLPEDLAQATTFGRGHALALIGAVAIAAATTCVLRWRIRDGERDPALRLPTTGLAPLCELGGFGFLFGILALFGIALSFDVILWFENVRRTSWLAVAVFVLAIPLWSWLFARPAVVERVALQAGLPRPTRSAWVRATVLSGVLFVLAGVIGFVVGRLGSRHAALLGEPITVMIATAVVLDIVDDARAHRAKLAPAAVLHQIQYAGVVERVLVDAGIPCHVHAGNLRALFAFFAPWAPAIVLVPESLAEDARAKIDAVLRVATARVPVAKVIAVSSP